MSSIYKIFLIVALLAEAFGLHCHKCDGDYHHYCNRRLGSDYFVQKCNDDFDYCIIVYDYDHVYKRRGCQKKDYCFRKKLEGFNCCYCQTDACNSNHFECLGSANFQSANLVIIMLMGVIDAFV